MAVVGAIFAAISRSFGRIANMALGWATVLLFGHIPDSKRLLLSLVTLGSIAWVAALVGVLMPDVGAVLLAAIPVPDAVDDTWIRLAMLAVVLGLPIVIGVATIFLLDAEERPSGGALIGQVLRGYPYAALLAMTLLFLAIIAILRKVSALARRWSDTSVPVLVKPGAYEEVVVDLEKALDDAGLDMARTRAPKVLTIPPKLLAAVGGSAVAGLVPDELVQLKRADLEVLIYPSDVSLLGARDSLARGRAAIAARLTFTEAYLTAAQEAQAIEDRLAELSRSGTAAADEFRAIDEELARIIIPFEEWDTLYRLRLQVEMEISSRRHAGPGQSGTRWSATGDPPQAPAGALPPLRTSRTTTPLRLAGVIQWTLATFSILLPAIDLLAAMLEQRGRRTHRS